MTKKKIAAPHATNGHAVEPAEVDPIELLIRGRVSFEDDRDPLILTALENLIGSDGVDRCRDPKVRACFKYSNGAWRNVAIALPEAHDIGDLHAALLHSPDRRFDQLCVFAPLDIRGRKPTWIVAACYWAPKPDDYPRPPEKPQHQLLINEIAALNVGLGLMPYAKAMSVTRPEGDPRKVDAISVVPLDAARFAVVSVGPRTKILWVRDHLGLYWPVRKLETPVGLPPQPPGRRSLAPSQEGMI